MFSAHNPRELNRGYLGKDSKFMKCSKKYIFFLMGMGVVSLSFSKGVANCCLEGSTLIPGSCKYLSSDTPQEGFLVQSCKCKPSLPGAKASCAALVEALY